MKFRVVVLPQARRDMTAATWWTEHHSGEQALLWLEKVYDQIVSLSDAPENNGLSAENGEFPYVIRERFVGLGRRPSYRAVFTIQGESVYVLAVRRGPQDVLRPGEIE